MYKPQTFLLISSFIKGGKVIFEGRMLTQKE